MACGSSRSSARPLEWKSGDNRRACMYPVSRLSSLQDSAVKYIMSTASSYNASAQPLQVDVLPSGFADRKDLANFVVSVLTLFFTACIPLVVLWFDRQQNKRQAEEARQQKLQEERQAAQQKLQLEEQAALQRLQGHVAQLSDAGGTAMGVISTFKDNCGTFGLSYTKVFKEKQDVLQGGLAVITRQELQQVDAARRRLQGIWDNVMDDYRDNLLGGKITDTRHGKMLRRGLTYMELVEPLEAANYARLQHVNPRVAAGGPFVLPAVGTQLTLQRNSQHAVRFPAGARPSRFRWLENQKTQQLVGRELWSKPTPDPSHNNVRCYHVNADAAQALQAQVPGDLSVDDKGNWVHSLIRHWGCLQEACTPLTL